MTTRFKLTTFCKGSRLIRERVGNVIKVDFGARASSAALRIVVGVREMPRSMETTDFAPGRIELPQVVSFADRSPITVRDLNDADAAILRTMVADQRVAYERELATLEMALDLRDAEPYLLPLFDSVAA